MLGYCQLAKGQKALAYREHENGSVGTEITIAIERGVSLSTHIHWVYEAILIKWRR